MTSKDLRVPLPRSGNRELDEFGRKVVQALRAIEAGGSGTVGPQGPPGPTGPAGATGATGVTGQGAYTVTTAGYTQPAIGSTVAVSVASTAWMVVGQPLFVMGGGFYVVTAIGGGTSVTLRNLGYYDSSVAGTSVSSGAGVVGAGVLPTRYPPLYTTPYVYYPFTEGVSPGSTYANQGSGGSAFDLTITGGSQLDWETPAPFGRCLTNGAGPSPGTGSSLSRASANFSGGIGTQHTFEVIYRRLSGAIANIISMNPGYNLALQGSNVSFTTSHNSPGGTVNTAPAEGSLGVWRHFMGTCDGATQRAYVDGVLLETNTLAGGTFVTTSSAMTIASARVQVARLAIYPVTVPQSYARDVTRAMNLWV